MSTTALAWSAALLLAGAGNQRSLEWGESTLGCDVFIVPVVLLSEDEGSVSRPGSHARADPHNPRQA
jgi:hypothetical protein